MQNTSSCLLSLGKVSFNYVCEADQLTDIPNFVEGKGSLRKGESQFRNN